MKPISIAEQVCISDRDFVWNGKRNFKNDVDFWIRIESSKVNITNRKDLCLYIIKKNY